MSILSFPSSPSTGSTYKSPNAQLYVYDGYSWSSNNLSSALSNNFFMYRTIYTRGYTHCGYQNSSPWRNTNRTMHNTDTTTNLGDMMDYNQSYANGGFSDYNTYIFNDSGGVGSGSTFTSSMSMQTETLRSHNSAWNLTTTRYDTKVLMNAGLTACYIAGGSSATTDKLCTVTDSMMASGSAPNCTAGAGGNTYYAFTGFFGQYIGTVGASGNSASLTWSTETWSSNGAWSFASNLDGVAKGLSSKWGLGYNGTTNTANTWYKFNDTTLSQISSFGRPDSCGEENLQIGQDWGYSLGSYDGAQTNNAYKMYYTSDTCTAGGSTMQPKGHGGMSSGMCGTGSCILLGGVMGTNI